MPQSEDAHRLGQAQRQLGVGPARRTTRAPRAARSSTAAGGGSSRRVWGVPCSVSATCSLAPRAAPTASSSSGVPLPLGQGLPQQLDAELADRRHQALIVGREAARRLSKSSKTTCTPGATDSGAASSAVRPRSNGCSSMTPEAASAGSSIHDARLLHAGGRPRHRTRERNQTRAMLFPGRIIGAIGFGRLARRVVTARTSDRHRWRGVICIRKRSRPRTASGSGTGSLSAADACTSGTTFSTASRKASQALVQLPFALGRADAFELPPNRRQELVAIEVLILVEVVADAHAHARRAASPGGRSR